MLFLSAVLVFVGIMVVSTFLLLVAERYLANYGTCTIDVNSGARTVEIEGGQTLLSALISNEVFIPSACGGHGTCGHCRVTVTAGGGPILPTETTFIQRREQRAGVRLACQVKVKQNMTLKMPEELLNVKQFTATVESTRSVTHDIKEIRFALNEPAEITQRPGQYIQVQAPSPDGPVYRAYSISSPEYDKNAVELNVRIVPNGLGSTYLHNLKQRDRVIFTGPYGEFRLNEDPTVEVVCVGGGCGMAPMRNIIYSLYRRWPQRSCWLFFGCRTTRDAFYLDDFKLLAKEHPNFKVIYALSDPLVSETPWEGDRGFIHLSVDKFLSAGLRRQAFLCGPPPMIDAVTLVLKEKGLADTDIFYDKF